MARPKSDPSTEAPSIKIGSRAIGKSEAQNASKQTVAGFTAMNELAVRERAKAKAAAQKAVAPIANAFESFLKQQGATALTGGGRERLDLQPVARVGERFTGQPQLLMLPVTSNFNLTGVPYDFGWAWGGSTRHKSDHLTGECSVFVQSENAAAAGISLLLTSDRAATVSVRPYITYTYDWAVKTFGIGSTAHVRGGVDASAWLDGTMITPVRRDEAFSASAGGFDGEKRDDGGGTAWGENINLTFGVIPGKTYAVSFGVYVEAEDSPWIGGAGSAGQMTAKVIFIVVERF